MALEHWHRAREDANVDLIPVMNLFVVLIPFLMLSAAFFHVGVIPTSLPSQGATSDIEEAADAVTVTLQVDADAIHVSAANPTLDKEVLDQLSVSIVRDEEGTDLEQLTTALHAIKSAYRESDTVVLLPGDGVMYRDVVRILDAAREARVPTSSGEARVPLFPVVVLSQKV